MITEFVLEKPHVYDLADNDALWKKLIQDLFNEFILFFIPDLFKVIDFNIPPEFLQQELFQKIIREKRGKQIADQILKVHLKNAEEKWILIHIEIQGTSEAEFSKRMFRYFYRIYDTYGQDIVALAILTDTSQTFRSNSYNYHLFGTSLTYKYNLFKVTDLDEKELIQSRNPFAIAVLASKYANVTKNNPEERYRFKKKLIHLILEHLYYPQHQRRFYISTLIYFIDYLLAIPLELTQKLYTEILRTEEGKNMISLDPNNLPPTWKELEKQFLEEGRKEGRAEGKTKAQIEMARKLLQDNVLSIEQIAKYTELSIEEIRKLI